MLLEPALTELPSPLAVLYPPPETDASIEVALLSSPPPTDANWAPLVLQGSAFTAPVVPVRLSQPPVIEV
jgi:hypothetical protein